MAVNLFFHFPQPGPRFGRENITYLIYFKCRIQVASDLQEVVQRQQQELDTRRPKSATASAGSEPAVDVNRQGDRSVPSSNIAQLKDLVKLVRAGLQTSLDTKDTKGMNAPIHSTDRLRMAHTTTTASTTNNVKQLKEEIAQLRSQLQQVQSSTARNEKTGGNETPVKSDASEADRLRAALLNAEMDVQRTNSEAKTLRLRLQEAEDMVQSLEQKLVGAQTEVQEAVRRAEQAESRAKMVEKDKEDALKLATDATEEAGRLHAACCAKDTKILAAQRLAERASTEQAAAEAKAASAEAAVAMERSNRASKETEVVRAHAEIQSLKAALEDSHKKARMDASSYAAQLDALHEQLAHAQHDARTARQELQAMAARVHSMEEAHSLSQKTIQSVQERLREKVEEAEAAIGRAEAAEKEAEELKTLQQDVETALGTVETKDLEIAALKEVLDRVSYAAQSKDAQLQQLMGQRDMLTHEIEALQRQIHDVQAAAADECRKWELELCRFKRAVEQGRELSVGPPIKLEIKVVDKNEEMQKALTRLHEAEMKAVRDQLEQLLAEEKKEHRQAVGALEEAHMAALRSARAAAVLPLQEEIERLEKQVTTVDSQYQDAQKRIRAVESELLAVQDQAAKFNAAMGKLEMRCAMYKEDLEGSRLEIKALEDRIRLLETEKAAVESELQTVQRDLQLAQDEIETLLTARLEDLRVSEEVGSKIEHQDTAIGEEDENPSSEEYRREADSVYPLQSNYLHEHDAYGNGNDAINSGGDAEAYADDNVSVYNERIHQFAPKSRTSPLKKLANFLRGKKHNQERGYSPTRLEW